MNGHGDWPEDPMDPRCPECDGPVSATSPYCMHCGVDLPAAGFGPGEPSASTESAPTVSTAPSSTSSASTSTAPASSTSASTTPTSTADREERGWLDPEGLLDNVSTVAVGVVGGLLAGVVATLALLFALPGAWPFWMGTIGWIAATIWIMRTPSVFGAARKAGYLLAGLLVALPVLLAFTSPMQENTLGNRLGLVVVLGIFVWPVAVVPAIGGFLAGRGRPAAD